MSAFCCTHHLDLSEYFNNPIFSDVRLYTKERKLYVSSIILCVQSPVFKKIIVQDEEKDIFLESFLDEEDEMEMVVSSLYNKTLLQLHNEVLFTVLKFSLTYQIDWMTDTCINYVKDNLTHNSCLSFTQTGYKMREYFGKNKVLEHCCYFVKNTKYLEEIVMSLEMLDNDVLTSIPPLFLSAVLLNKLRRDEKRIVDLLIRWFGLGKNIIRAMELIPHLQLSQLFLVNKDIHSEFFELLVSSDKLTSEDRKMVLEMSNMSIDQSRGCIVTGVGFSKEISMEISTGDIKDFLRSDTWTNCSFDDIVMLKQYKGVSEYVYIELFLTWSRFNPTTEYQLNRILASVDLNKINPEYLQDLLAHIKHPETNTYPDTVGIAFEGQIITHDYTANPGSVRQFTTQKLTPGNVKAIKLKKHTLTIRPCTVSCCRQRSLAFVDIKLKSGGGVPWFKVGKTNTPPTMLDHCHNKHVHHVYFFVDYQIVSCFTEKWEYLEPKLNADNNDVVIKVICNST